MTALRQKLPFGRLESNFRFSPESRLNSEIAACPKSAMKKHRTFKMKDSSD
jgi:hypothetical protein